MTTDFITITFRNKQKNPNPVYFHTEPGFIFIIHKITAVISKSVPEQRLQILPAEEPWNSTSPG